MGKTLISSKPRLEEHKPFSLLLKYSFIFIHQNDELLLKITAPAYFLPVIEALEAGKILSSGRTRPMVIRGACHQTGDRGEYVVKLKGAPEMYPDASLNELLASFIAAELDFNIPEPAIINLTDKFVEAMKGRHENFTIASKSIGINFGSAYQTHYQQIVAGQTLSRNLMEKLLELFAFDVFIGNADRRINKPNFLASGKDLLIYDHEMAFSFTQLLPFARNPQPWTILQSDMDWLSKNFCFHHLKGNSFDFSNFAARLGVINEDFWQKAEQTIPADWKTGSFNTIKSYLNSIVQHKDDFASELNRVLQ